MISPVNKLFRYLAVLAGLGTVIWVMRDRFISLALPREPEAPAFRVAPHPTLGGAPSSQQDDLTIIKGIGPVYAARLEEAGITSLVGLGDADAKTLAAVINIPADRVGDWIKEAAFLSSFQGN